MHIIMLNWTESYHVNDRYRIFSSRNSHSLGERWQIINFEKKNKKWYNKKRWNSSLFFQCAWHGFFFPSFVNTTFMMILLLLFESKFIPVASIDPRTNRSSDLSLSYSSTAWLHENTNMNGNSGEKSGNSKSINTHCSDNTTTSDNNKNNPYWNNSD